MNILIMGGPGAGKGTMSAKIVEKFNVNHISTGDIFRSEIGKGTALGMEAKSFMDKGLLVPDEVVNNMVKSYLEKTGRQEKRFTCWTAIREHLTRPKHSMHWLKAASLPLTKSSHLKLTLKSWQIV